MKTPELMALLRQCTLLKGGPFAWFENVPNSTGYAKRRSCDALALGLWPSAGLLLHGFELKVSRGDWLRELRQPEKATPLKRFCDHWWLVSGDDTVSPHSHDLPMTWGHLVVRNGQLVQAREAPPLQAVPLDRGFVAALARKLAPEKVWP